MQSPLVQQQAQQVPFSYAAANHPQPDRYQKIEKVSHSTSSRTARPPSSEDLNLLRVVSFLPPRPL
jgi:hypothetical protein